MSCDKSEYDVNEIIPNLWLGNVKSAYDQAFHSKYNIKYIISVFDEFDETKRNKNVNYILYPIKDSQLCEVDLTHLFKSTGKIIQKALGENNGVLVHCKRGHHRSASVVVAFLIDHLKVDYKTAVKYINKLRPCALRRDSCIGKELYRYYLQINNQKCQNIKCMQEESYNICKCH